MTFNNLIYPVKLLSPMGYVLQFSLVSSYILEINVFELASCFGSDPTRHSPFSVANYHGLSIVIQMNMVNQGFVWYANYSCSNQVTTQ